MNQISSNSSQTTSPPLRSRHSNISFTSLSPSDSRSNYRPIKQQQQKLQQQKQHLTNQQQQQQQQQQQKQHEHRITSSTQQHQSDTTSKLNQTHPDDSNPFYSSLSSKAPFPIGIRPQDLDLSSIEDPDDLFIHFTIREIRSIEQRARVDANQKREDLRQMVGERYRDLLGAADSIVRMKTCTDHLLEKLDQARIESDRNILNSRESSEGNSQKRSTIASSKITYVLATLIRLFLDLSEHVWRSLERQDFLTASRYISLGRFISNELKMGSWDETGKIEPSEVIEMFPIIERQSETLSQLGPQILSGAKLFLRKWDVKNQATMEALAAITLLDNTSLFDSLQLLLQVRKTVFRSLIASISGSWVEHVQSAVKLLVATLMNVNQIFLRGDFLDLLKAIIDGSSKEMPLKPLFSLLPNPHQLMRYIPKSIIEFCPLVAPPAGSEGEVELFPITLSWFEACRIDLIYFIDQKLNQIQNTESLVEFQYQLHRSIVQLDGEFESTINSFQSQLIISLNRRFYELYQSRLNQLKDEIIQSLLHPPLLKTEANEKAKKDWIFNENAKEDWIFNEKLPPLEPNDPTKFTKYLDSIQNRIQGKLIASEENEMNSTTTSNKSIVSQIELTGNLLRQDFKRWTKGVEGSSTESTTFTGEEDQAKLYVNLGNQFVENCLQEINQVLHQEVEKSNIERELHVGNLALQILSTRNSFMMNLSLVELDHDENQDGNELIQKFEIGLNQILSDSTRHWSQLIIDESVRLFNSSHLKLGFNNHEQFNLENKEGNLRTKPSDSIFKSLDFMSKSMIGSLGVHRIKLQQGNLLKALLDEFIVRILDDQFVDLIIQSVQSSDDYLWAVILFDLLFLMELILNQNEINCSKKGLKRLEELIELLNKDGDETHEKKKIMKENVVKFKLTIMRLWWPLMSIDDANSDGLDHHSKLLVNDLKNPSQLNTLMTSKLPKFGGIACVKPGNRFTLLSVS